MQDKVVILVENIEEIELEGTRFIRASGHQLPVHASSHHRDQSTACGHDAPVGAGHGSGLQAIVAGENPPLRQLLG